MSVFINLVKLWFSEILVLSVLHSVLCKIQGTAENFTSALVLLQKVC